MNYLAHFVYNHEVCGRPVEPYFALGVVLPDLWLRYSRRHRIRWPAVRAATLADRVDVQLQAGLLNHVAVDRAFHVLPVFLRWQRELRAAIDGDAVHPALIDFLVHMCLELALDHHLLVAAPDLVERFYGVVAQCDARRAAARVGVLGAVSTDGLDEVIRQFVARRFLRHYRTPAGMTDVVRIVLKLAEIPAPPNALLDDITARSVVLADPAAVWAGLPRGQGCNIGGGVRNGRPAR